MHYRERVASLSNAPPVLPVDAVVGDVEAALRSHGVAVLEAEPGAGKTTRIPLHLLTAFEEERTWLSQPRRVAARAAARRLAGHLGEPLGRTVGVTTRDDRQVSRHTRLEVLTTGVVLRRLQRDPSLEGVDLLIFDEFHERSVEADLSLAFALEARAALRDDLKLLVMSATLEGARVARLLGDAPTISTPGRSFPVDVEHRDGPSDRRGLPAAVEGAARDLLPEGDVLVFLPGAGEIRATVDHLRSVMLPTDPDILPLHGALPAGEQDQALEPAVDGRRRVIVATDVAETSLTIEGIRGVIDAGWSREPRFDAATGMTGLVTVPASRASADQRAGRAGRTAPGRAIRLWPAREHLARDAQPRPAIATDDLAGVALQIAAWGIDVTDPGAVAEVALLDPPPAATWQRSVLTLQRLGALEGGRISEHGRRMADLPLPPRLADLVLVGAELRMPRLACELAAILGDRDLVVADRNDPTSDLALRVRALRGEAAVRRLRLRRGSLVRAREQVERLMREVAPRDQQGSDDPELSGMLIAHSWPERIARLREGQRGRFLLAGGRGATLPEADVLAGEPWLAVAHLDRGADNARIHLAAAVDPAELRRVFADDLHLVEEVSWRDGDVRAEVREELGALVLSRSPLAEGDAHRRHAALLEGLRTDGLGLLGWNDEAQALRARVAFVAAHRGEPWPDLSDEGILADLEGIVGPFLHAARRRRDLAKISMTQVLTSQLGRQLLNQLDRLAPTHLTVPSGSRIRVRYEDEGPILAVRLQELFGAQDTPTVLDGAVKVTMHLLSPAQRPVQVTDDLAGFWQRIYPQVRAELRGRYPKHDWPEDPTTAKPRRGVRRRR